MDGNFTVGELAAVRQSERTVLLSDVKVKEAVVARPRFAGFFANGGHASGPQTTANAASAQKC